MGRVALAAKMTQHTCVGCKHYNKDKDACTCPIPDWVYLTGLTVFGEIEFRNNMMASGGPDDVCEAFIGED